MTIQNENQKAQRYYVIIAKVRRTRRLRSYIADPEIFFESQMQALKVKDELIKKGKYKPKDLKIQIVWKVKL